MNRKLSILLLLAGISTVSAQLPDTDIWLFELEKNKQGAVTLSQARNITARSGYDNQPAFSADGRQLYYAALAEGEQTEIRSYHLKKKKDLPVTKSPESEYSPRPAMLANQLSAVVVEKDSSQKIHLISSVDGSVLSRLPVDSVGYYTFLNKDTVVYYKLGSPHSLRYLVMSTGEDRFICNNPVRSLITVNRHTLLYGVREQDRVTCFYYDFLLAKAYRVAGYLSPADDFIYHPDLGLLRSEGSSLLSYDKKSGDWKTFADLAGSGVAKVGRFTIDARGKWLAAVSHR